MMSNPKEKAEELVMKFYIQEIKYYENIVTAKQCALIAVDEILNQFTWKPSTGMSFWEEVKQEIEKL